MLHDNRLYFTLVRSFNVPTLFPLPQHRTHNDTKRTYIIHKDSHSIPRCPNHPVSTCYQLTQPCETAVGPTSVCASHATQTRRHLAQRWRRSHCSRLSCLADAGPTVHVAHTGDERPFIRFSCFQKGIEPWRPGILSGAYRSYVISRRSPKHLTLTRIIATTFSSGRSRSHDCGRWSGRIHFALSADDVEGDRTVRHRRERWRPLGVL